MIYQYVLKVTTFFRSPFDPTEKVKLGPETADEWVDAR